MSEKPLTATEIERRVAEAFRPLWVVRDKILNELIDKVKEMLR